MTLTLPSRLDSLRALRVGLAVSVLSALLATLVVFLVPRVRGLEFLPELRSSVVVPAAWLLSVAVTFFYASVYRHSRRPRVLLFGVLSGLTTVLLASLSLRQPNAAAQSAPIFFVMTLTLTWLVPRWFERPIVSRAGTWTISLMGLVEAVTVLGALSTERLPPPTQATLPFDVPRALFDVDHKFVILPSGARIHYVDEGKGDTLLFLHGNPSWSFQWRELIQGLRGSYRCVALDYPGFGLSEGFPGYGFTPAEQSRTLEEFVDHLKLRDLTLVMQDWGGPIGLGFAGGRPELIKRMVLGSTWAWPTGFDSPRGKFSFIVGGPVGEFAQMNFNGFATFGINNGVVRPLPQQVADLYVRPLRPVNRRGIAAFYPGQITAATAYFDQVESRLPVLADKPTLIFWALRDLGFPRSDLQRFERAFPHHKTVELPNADHFFFEDTAPLLLSEMKQFLSSTPRM